VSPEPGGELGLGLLNGVGEGVVPAVLAVEGPVGLEIGAERERERRGERRERKVRAAPLFLPSTRKKKLKKKPKGKKNAFSQKRSFRPDLLARPAAVPSRPAPRAAQQLVCLAAVSCREQRRERGERKRVRVREREREEEKRLHEKEEKKNRPRRRKKRVFFLSLTALEPSRVRVVEIRAHHRCV